jgi:hypothetical protein
VPLPVGFSEIPVMSECGSDRANLDRQNYLAPLPSYVWRLGKSVGHSAGMSAG